MKRREFLKATFFTTAALSVLSKASGLFSEALAQTWVKVGTLGYKEVAPPMQVKAGKSCASCKHYEADAKTPDGGKCKLPAMKGGYVKAAGYCNMWLKKA